MLREKWLNRPVLKFPLKGKHCFPKCFSGVQTHRKQTKCFASLLHKRRNICRGSEMFLETFSNISNFASLTNVVCAHKQGNISGNNISATMFLPLRGPLFSRFYSNWRLRALLSFPLPFDAMLIHHLRTSGVLLHFFKNST